MQEKIYTADGIHCGSCISTIKTQLKDHSEIKEIKGNSVSKQIKIFYNKYSDSLETEIMQELDDIGYTIIPSDIPSQITKIQDTENSTPNIVDNCTSQSQVVSEIKTSKLSPSNDSHNKKIRSHWYKGFMSCLLGGTLFILSTVGFQLSTAAMYIAAALSLLVMWYVGKDIYYSAYTTFTNKKLKIIQRINMDTLFTISTSIAWITAIISLFIPIGLHMLLSAPLMILGFRHVGKAIQEKSELAFKSSLNFREHASTHITLIENWDKKSHNEINKYPVDQLRVGQIIKINPGETIPVDGTPVSDKKIFVSHKLNTGSDDIFCINPGTPVLAGMKANNEIIMKIDKPENASYLARRQKHLDDAILDKSKIEENAEKMLGYFVPTIFFLSFCSALSIGFLLDPFTGIQVGISILVAVCPCIWGFITPLMVIIAMNKATKNNLECLSGNRLILAKEIETIIFDVFGTLTKGAPKVELIKILEPHQEEEILKYLYILEKNSQHAVAKAVCSYIEDSKAMPNLTTDIKHQGKKIPGVQAEIDGCVYSVGNSKLMRDLDINIEQLHIPAEHSTSDKTSIRQIIYIAREKEPIGYMILKDDLRPGIKNVMKQLRASNKNIIACTGGPEDSIKPMLDELSITKAAFDCIGDSKSSPKTAQINNWKKIHGKLMMVGNDFNDENAYAECELSVHVKSSAAADIETKANVVIHGESLQPLLSMFEISKQTNKYIYACLYLSLAFNVIATSTPSVLLFTLDYKIDPSLEALFMVMQVIIVLGFAYWFKEKEASPPASEQLLHTPVISTGL